MIAQAAAGAIGLYQRYLSPHKGFHCAYRARHGGDSCSGYVQRMILERGLWRALPLARARFADCGHAGLLILAERQERMGRRRNGVDRVTDWMCSELPCDLACCAAESGIGDLACSHLGCAAFWTG